MVRCRRPFRGLVQTKRDRNVAPNVVHIYQGMPPGSFVWIGSTALELAVLLLSTPSRPSVLKPCAVALQYAVTSSWSENDQGNVKQ